MTNDAIRIAVAEEMGIKDQNECPSCHLYKGQGHTSFCTYVPDYPNDLNACAEMEATLTTEEQKRYAYNLFCINERDTPDSLEYFALAHSTALQRCEAFLRVKGKWA